VAILAAMPDHAALRKLVTPAGPIVGLRLVTTVLVATLSAVVVGLGGICASEALLANTPLSTGALVGLGVFSIALLLVSLRLHGTRAELARSHAEARDLASTDALTGACTRPVFELHLDHLFRPGAEIALMLVDVDDLRSVNDSLGHAVGDAVLRGTAERIESCLRSTDLVSRLSGDEFGVLLPRVGDAATVEGIARRIIEVVQRPYPAEQHSCTVSASAGVVILRGEASTSELLRNADVALASAKRQGKGRYVIYRSDVHAGEVERLTFERELRTALEQDQFVLHYQPMVDSKSRRILGVEALVRWQHPVRGLVPPLDFIPVAESTGMIIPLGAWVLREACRQTQRWRTNNPGLLDDFVVSVNVSARQLFGTQLEEDVVSAVNESGLDPRHLVLEIIESQVMTDLSAALKQIAALKGLGVRIAIDDFGSGYSSLGHLRELPVDFLKLDKSFIDSITDSVKSQELTRTVAQLSRALSITTVAEGVETVEQADVLHALDVNLCQGFFFARPIDAHGCSLLLQRARHLPEELPWRGTAPASGGGRLSVRVPPPKRAGSASLPN